MTDRLKALSPEPMLLEVEWVRDRASRVMLADGTVRKNQEDYRKEPWFNSANREVSPKALHFSFPNPFKVTPGQDIAIPTLHYWL